GRIEIIEALVLGAGPHFPGSILIKSAHHWGLSNAITRGELFASAQLQLRPLKTVQTDISSDPPIAALILKNAVIEIGERRRLRSRQGQDFSFNDLDQPVFIGL